MYEKKPWLQFYGSIPHSLNYPSLSMYGLLQRRAVEQPAITALFFLGKRMKLAVLDTWICRLSRGLAREGLKPGERVLVCLPNIPQAVIVFYALNRLGAVPVMIHPLSAPTEIEAYARQTSCVMAFTLDAFYPRFSEIRARFAFRKTFVCRVIDFVGTLTALGFALTQGRGVPPVLETGDVSSWQTLVLQAAGAPELEHPNLLADTDLALILFSGGSTGRSKAIMLSSRNCNALAIQTNAAGGPIRPGQSMMSVLPMFHGFGLAVGIHAVLVHGGTCILVPRFSPDGLAKLIRKYKPQYLAGVPSLFDALASNRRFKKTPLAGFTGLFCGGDTLGRETRERFEAVVRANGGDAPLREGYGLTESVTANILMPREYYRERSIGIPYPDMLVKIVRPGTEEECISMEDGEICVSGPTLMLGYLDEPGETASVLRQHKDGHIWLHTGDIGCMDEDGFFYFKLRLKRLIKTSGIAVYPTHIEEVLNRHPAVRLSCVIAVSHAVKGHVPKAFISLHEGWTASADLEAELINFCHKELAPYACPHSIEFREHLPSNAIGKVAFRILEQEEEAKE